MEGVHGRALELNGLSQSSSWKLSCQRRARRVNRAVTPGLHSLTLGFIPSPRTQGQKLQEIILNVIELISKIFKAKVCGCFIVESLGFHWDNTIRAEAGDTMHRVDNNGHQVTVT